MEAEVERRDEIVHDPALVLLDEPTDGLDPLQRDDMLALIRRVGSEFGMDIVISSHHLEEAERICDDVVILGAGKVVRAGSLSELRRDAERLTVVVDERAAELAALLRDAGFDVLVEGETVSVAWSDGVHDAVRDAVADLDIGIRRLAAERQTLEDVYMEASA